jgi:hypothetical protein
MRKALPVLVAILAAGSLATVAAGASLYSLLRTTTYPDISLPAPFSSARVVASSPTAQARSLGAVGQLEVQLVGPDPTDGILFTVFKSEAAARAGLASVLPTTPDLHLQAGAKVPGYTTSGSWAGWVPDVDAINQETRRTVIFAVVQEGSVVVSGFTYSVYANRGNRAGAFALAKSGAAHVRALTARA